MKTNYRNDDKQLKMYKITIVTHAPLTNTNYEINLFVPTQKITRTTNDGTDIFQRMHFITHD